MSPFSPAFRAVYAGLVAILLSACVGDSTAQTASPPAAKAAPSVPTVPVTPSTHFALPDFAPLVERYGLSADLARVLEGIEPLTDAVIFYSTYDRNGVSSSW